LPLRYRDGRQALLLAYHCKCKLLHKQSVAITLRTAPCSDPPCSNNRQTQAAIPHAATAQQHDCHKQEARGHTMMTSERGVADARICEAPSSSSMNVLRVHHRRLSVTMAQGEKAASFHGVHSSVLFFVLPGPPLYRDFQKRLVLKPWTSRLKNLKTFLSERHLKQPRLVVEISNQTTTSSFPSLELLRPSVGHMSKATSVPGKRWV
jgi:hypothetical protein